MTVGYIGASGLMGHGMAKNLLAKGQKLAITVHKQRDRVKDLLDAGATLADNAAALGASCDIVLICVTGSPQVEAVVAGPDGLLSNPKAGLIIVDCSTSEPHSTTHLRELAHSKGVVFVDAPLARSPVEAEAGRLNIMVGATMMGEAVHQSLSMASALGFGKKYVSSMVEAQERINGITLVPKK